jgi:hypothetical protein
VQKRQASRELAIPLDIYETFKRGWVTPALFYLCTEIFNNELSNLMTPKTNPLGFPEVRGLPLPKQYGYTEEVNEPAPPVDPFDASPEAVRAAFLQFIEDSNIINFPKEKSPSQLAREMECAALPAERKGNVVQIDVHPKFHRYLGFLAPFLWALPWLDTVCDLAAV